MPAGSLGLAHNRCSPGEAGVSVGEAEQEWWGGKTLRGWGIMRGKEDVERSWSGSDGTHQILSSFPLISLPPFFLWTCASERSPGRPITTWEVFTDVRGFKSPFAIEAFQTLLSSPQRIQHASFWCGCTGCVVRWVGWDSKAGLRKSIQPDSKKSFTDVGSNP